MTDTPLRYALYFVFLGLVVWETLNPSRVLLNARPRVRIWHGAINLVLGLIGTGISYLLFFPAWHSTAQWGAQQGWGLLHMLPTSFIGRSFAGLLLLDLWTYWWHRLNHRVKFLWRFHRTHHSDPWMDVTSARRFHPGEILLSSALRIPVILVFGVELWHLALYDVVMLAVVLFHHANISVPAGTDRALRLVIPTPVMHKIHHSRVPSDTDSNYTALFSVWDRLFGSFRLRSEGQAVSFGLDGYDDLESQSFVGLMLTPFRARNERAASHMNTVDKGL